MTKYTNEQIREAIREGHGRPRDGIIPDWEVDMYQDFLEALQQQDDWTPGKVADDDR